MSKKESIWDSPFFMMDFIEKAKEFNGTSFTKEIKHYQNAKVLGEMFGISEERGMEIAKTVEFLLTACRNDGLIKDINECYLVIISNYNGGEFPYAMMILGSILFGEYDPKCAWNY